VRNELKGDQLS